MLPDISEKLTAAIIRAMKKVVHSSEMLVNI
jgi:hypothetical protein